MSTQADMTAHLNEAQLARIACAFAARDLLRSTDGMMKAPAPSIHDLIDLTGFLLSGVVDPNVFLNPSAPKPDWEQVLGVDKPWWTTVAALLIEDEEGPHYIDRIPDGTGGYYWMPRAGNDETPNLSYAQMETWIARAGVTTTDTDPPV